MSCHSRMIAVFVLLYTLAFISTSTTSNDNLLLELEKFKDVDGKFKQSNFDNIISALQQAITKDKESEHREKRILMHSEKDMIAEITKLREEVTQLQQGRGTVYVRWGKASCPLINGTTMVYKGYMGGKFYSDKGDGTNHLCLPEDPTWGNYQDGRQNYRGYIWGTEIQEPFSYVFGKYTRDEDLPCAVCKVPRVSIMIPARVDCYPGWRMEYTGYLMASYNVSYAMQYVCVDADPDFVAGGAYNADGNLLYLVESACGSLHCPPYTDGREIACVVCSM